MLYFIDSELEVHTAMFGTISKNEMKNKNAFNLRKETMSFDCSVYTRCLYNNIDYTIHALLYNYN